jgi:cell division protein ZipA
MKTVFSVGHLREPGVFNDKTLDGLSTPGLLLFMHLPGPLPATEAVRMMFGVAGQLAEKLGGKVCDEQGQRFTSEGYIELHKQASQFDQAHFVES